MAALSSRTSVTVLGFVLGALVLTCASNSYADGMIPATSVVIVNEADGEASLMVTNSNAKPELLLVTLQDVPEDTQPLLLVTPPVSRVEPGKAQLVRFILQSKTPLTTQRLKRVVIEGVPQAADKKAGGARIGLGVRQNLPVIVHPKGLAPNREPWTGLAWSLQGDQLTVRNDTPYVVRLAQQVSLLPGTGTATLPRAYILPGDRLNVPVKDAGGARSVRISPATVYGYVVDTYDAPLTATTSAAQ